MNRKQKLDSSKYCPDSCDSLYGGQCIMRINGEFNGSFRLLSEPYKLGMRYIRRNDCPLKEEGWDCWG